MGGVTNGITDSLGLTDSGDAGNASRDAAKIQARYQQQALDYLKQREAIPQQFREEALNQMAGAYGIPGGASAQEFVTNAKSSPIYQAIMGNIPQQEEAILRNQSATGALRGGGTDLMLANNQRNTQANAYGAVLGGINNMAQLPSLAPQIASGITGIGTTQAQGILGQAQTNQAVGQQGFGNLMGMGQLGLAAYQAFCDPRLKANARKIGEAGGVQIYEWDWNEAANEIGLVGKCQGPMADEIARFAPERIENRFGYMYVRAA